MGMKKIIFYYSSFLIIICFLVPNDLWAKNSYMFELNPQYMYESDKNEQDENVSNEYFYLGFSFYFKPVYVNNVPFEIAPLMQHASGFSGYYVKGLGLDNLAAIQQIAVNFDYIFSAVHTRLSVIKQSLRLEIPGDDVTFDVMIYGGAIGYYLAHNFILAGTFALSDIQMENSLSGYSLERSGYIFGSLFIYTQKLTQTKYLKIEGSYNYQMGESTTDYVTTTTTDDSVDHEITADGSFYFNQLISLSCILNIKFGDNKEDEGMSLGSKLNVFFLTQFSLYIQYKRFIPKNDNSNPQQQFLYGMTLRI